MKEKSDNSKQGTKTGRPGNGAILPV